MGLYLLVAIYGALGVANSGQIPPKLPRICPEILGGGLDKTCPYVV